MTTEETTTKTKGGGCDGSGKRPLMGQIAVVMDVCMCVFGGSSRSSACFDLFFLLNYKSSPGRRPSQHHNAGIIFLNGRGRWRTISPPTQRCHTGCL